MKYKIMKSELNQDYIIAEFITPVKFFKWTITEGYWKPLCSEIKTLEDAERLLNIYENNLAWYTEVTK